MEFAINVGDLLVTVVGLLIAYVLNNMFEQMKEIKTTVKELSTSLISLDKRVVRLEVQSGIPDRGCK